MPQAPGSAPGGARGVPPMWHALDSGEIQVGLSPSSTNAAGFTGSQKIGGIELSDEKLPQVRPENLTLKGAGRKSQGPEEACPKSGLVFPHE